MGEIISRNILFMSRRAVFFFQVVFNRSRINQYSIDWSKVIDKKNLSKSLPFCCPSCFFFYPSFRNISIYRFKIHTYKLKGPDDYLCNQLLEPIGLQIIHLKKIETLFI
ncbi:hypothetical protein NC653_019451 [Populus alba x Populus x berolinensis]|uniref:Ycf2 N-terminal domain-containing protein n=1 Tax=Populus alba x Populus x berolinensis TaxID=444605 RepID=A0AAD6QJ31_9ROSI|nr:hypothetical protein NC653_019451 [Populus alba x Populus x berolinensis]